MLYSSREQGNFRGLEASRPRPRISKRVLEAKDVLEISHLCKRCVPMRSTDSFVLYSLRVALQLNLITINQCMRLNFNLLLRWSVTLQLSPFLRSRRHFNVSNHRKGKCPPLQRPVVLAIVQFGSKGRVPMRSIGSVEQPTSNYVA